MFSCCPKDEPLKKSPPIKRKKKEAMLRMHVLLKSIFNGYFIIKMTLFTVIIILFKFNTVFSQGISFSVNSRSNLGLVYQTESDFETERLIDQGISFNIRARNRRIFVSAKTIPTLNNSFTRLPSDMFSMQLANTNASPSSTYYSKYALSFNERTILRHFERNNRSYFYNYDLYVRPVGYDYEPSQYMYSIIFTLSEF